MTLVFSDEQEGAQPAVSATVWVYRAKSNGTVGRLAPPVYCDNKEIARLEGGKFFRIALKEASYILRSDHSDALPLALNVSNGREYYVRMDTRVAVLKGRGRMVLAIPEQGMLDVTQLLPIDPKDNKDPSRIW